MIRFKRHCAYTSAHRCRFCLHVGTVAVLFGNSPGRGVKLELFTPFYRFRLTKV